MVSINIIMAIVGFAVGVSLAAGSLALAADSARGHVYRDVLRRPLVMVLAAVYIVACGAVGAILFYGLA